MHKIIVFLFLVLTLLLYLTPLHDPDLWWHIKSGEFIYSNHFLPDEDPFSYTGEKSARSEFILKQYWLAQILYFGVFKLGGFWGLITLRILIYLSIFAIFLVLAKELNYYLKAALLGFLIFGLFHYINDRPSALSFLFFAAEIYVLKKERFWLLPPLMLLWANCHGGFIIGDVILFIWLVYGMAKGDYKGMKIFLPAAGLFLSMLNPNTYKAFTLTFSTLSSDYVRNIMEFKSPVDIYRAYKPLWFIYIAVSIVGILLLLLPKIRQINIRDSIILLALIIGAVRHYRLAPFLYVSLAFLSVDYLKSYNAKIPSRLWRVDIAIAAMLVILIIWFMPTQKPEPFAYVIYPVEGADFILKEKPEANIFNSFEWGGYLILKLYPEYRVFSDTRALSINSFSQLQKIEETGDLTLLSKHNINTAILFIINPYLLSGIPPLIRTLHDSNEWELVFLKDTTAIFLRDTPRNRPIIAKYRLPRDEVYRQIIPIAALYLKSNKNNPNLYFVLGDAYFLLKDFERGKQAYKVGLEIKDNPEVRKKLEKLGN